MSIDTSNVRVVETQIDPETGEQVTIERAPFLKDVDGKGNWVPENVVELDRQPAPPVVVPIDAKVAALEAQNDALMAALTKADPKLAAELAKIPARDALIVEAAAVEGVDLG